MSQSRLELEQLRPELELARFMRDVGGRGAIVSFVGLVRAENSDGQAVSDLVLEHYPEMTEFTLSQIAAETEVRFAGVMVYIAHRVGTVRAGDPIVFTAAAAAHRRIAFNAADHLMDRLKTEAAFWKREDGPDGSRWIEPTDSDLQDRQRWNDVRD